MRYAPTFKGTVCIVIIVLLFLLMGIVSEVWPYAGQRCTWVSDCDLNETCQEIPFSQRDGSSYRGICMPKDL